MKRLLLYLTALTCLCFAGSAAANPSAGPVSARRSSVFIVPSGLRKRVAFWVDVFAKYGRSQIVVHHRERPWVVFTVLDFAKEAAEMSPVALEKHKEKRTNEVVAGLNAACTVLASGQPAESGQERLVAAVMKEVPGGAEKYKRLVDEELIRTQTGIREKWMEAVRRAGRYMHIMEGIFREQRLPVELSRLPFIESSFDYGVRSSAGAVGLWQFMPRTGRRYMTVNYLIDERRDVVASTRAAALYLQEAHNQLGSWPLAITSYNHGVAGVKRKIHKSGTEDIVRLIEDPEVKAFGFASSNFYPEFLAALQVYDNYRTYFPGLQLYPRANIVEHRLEHATSAPYLCKQLGVSREVLEELNYAVSSAIWEGRFRIPKGYSLKIPAEHAGKLAALRVAEPVGQAASSVYGGMVYQVRKGDSLLKIAKKFGLSVAKLKELNNLRSNTVGVGQKLVVRMPETIQRRPAEPPRKPVPTAADTPKPQPQGAAEPRTYKVKSGDSLWSISRKLGVSVEALKQANHLKDKHIKPGQILKRP
jgi:membrane-bound lytic murein transglycosylase D